MCAFNAQIDKRTLRSSGTCLTVANGLGGGREEQHHKIIEIRG